MSDQIDPILDLPSHPFYTGCIDPGNDRGLPVSLPFSLGIHPRYALPRLVITREIRTALNIAYSAGSMISTPLGESPLASDRMTEVLEKLVFLHDGAIKGKKFLEIGCGNGELLNQLKRKGARVTGLEIGPQANVVEERYGIRVLKEPLRLGTLNETFDCIFSYGCLEHIEDIETFIAASRAHLNEGGLFFHSVPNSLMSFEHVHLDHLLHEHVNYFTPANGVALFKAQGFDNADSTPTRAGNELMVWGFHRQAANLRWPIENFTREVAVLRDYAEKLDSKIRSSLDAFREMIGKGESVGFYAGGFEYSLNLPAEKIRYFDGDSFKHGKQWLPGLSAIEAPVALASNPVSKLVICKPHYFSAIKEALVDIGVDEKCILDIDSLV